MQNLSQGAVNTVIEDGVAEFAEKNERQALITWPGKQAETRDGWILRLGDGRGHRPNSVATVDFLGSDLGQAVAAVEAIYAANGLKTMFHIHPATQPTGLAEFLADRGYRAAAVSVVYRGKADVAAACCPGGDVRSDQPGEFARLVKAGSSSPQDGQERLDVVARLTIPNVSLVACHEGIGRACGHGGAVEDVVAINLVRTEPGFRRLGLARQVLGALARWALAQNCPNLTLCVDEGNVAARTLYEACGFTPVYRYHYRVRD